MFIEILESRKLLAGVTILTHGQSGNITGWIAATADDIQDRAGGTSAASVYVMTVKDDGGLKVTSFKLEDGNKPLDQTTAGEAIIKLDWSSVSNGSPFTQDVAQVVSDYLTVHHDGVPDFTALPFHLIGHSRGASLMVALSYDLGQHGIWVDQVTNLDPHPVGADVPIIGRVGDTKMKTYENVIFGDTYYREGNDDILDPNGQSVDGTYNLNLKDSVQKKHLLSAHLGVTAYYDGTVDLNGKSDNDSPIYSSWYDDSATKPPRDKTGFYYTLLGGGVRPNEGVSTQFGGTAGRSSVKEKGSQWSNITNARVVGTSIIGLDQPISVKALYDDADSSATVTFFLDRDQNPLNDNTAQVFGTKAVSESSDPSGVTMAAQATGIGTGNYYLAAKIFDADGHVRYAYSATSIDVERADFSTFSNGVVTVAGTSSADSISISGDGIGAASVVHVNRNCLTQTLDAPNVSRISVDAGDGNDVVVAEAGSPAVYFFGGNGNDILVGGDGNDTLTGGAGNNRLSGNGGDDRLNGSGGRDLLSGGTGNDRLYGNSGNDNLDGGAGVDRLFGGDGNDFLTGGTSNDKLYGEAGNDTLLGQDQNDLLVGGSGNDSIIGGDGIDTIQGNAGNDIISARDGFADIIDAGSGTDKGLFDQIDTKISVENELA